MKSILLRICLFVLIVVGFTSCQLSNSCSAYSSMKGKPMYKPTFLKDTARR
ncbi:hypothetical protein [Pontibacter arcticus]|uniref:hypothetical protein n=1 Tax=Pontibacter arcticus TaxID=2080288 RepID=UPI00140324B8|nr:hypothetical protein [Pontibacter arcticus]